MSRSRQPSSSRRRFQIGFVVLYAYLLLGTFAMIMHLAEVFKKKDETPPAPPQQPPSGSESPGLAVDVATSTVVLPVPVIKPSEDPNLVDVRTIKPWTVEQTVAMPEVKYPPFPPVIQTKPSSGSLSNFQELARGLGFTTKINYKKGGLASVDRKNPANYAFTFSLDISQPVPLTKTSELAKLNPHIKRMLPGLEELFNNSKVSPYYHQIFTRKQNEIRKKMSALDKVLDPHNFYDTETILEMRHPKSERMVLWLQSEMDVVSDGSDGDRLATMSENILNSNFYQPSTSYRWKKRTDKKNPLLTVWEDRLKSYKSQLATAKPEAKQALNAKIDHAQRVVTELKTYSFLIAEYDPFIVMPLGVVNQQGSYSPSFGDFVVVIVGNKLYPAIVGDAGPRYKTGEGSLRLAKTINPKAGIYSRPVSDLTVSYVIFPGSADDLKGPPDYRAWEKRCKELLDEIGGLGEGYSLHQWEDLLAPKTPDPAPNPPASDRAPEPDAPQTPAP